MSLDQEQRQLLRTYQNARRRVMLGTFGVLVGLTTSLGTCEYPTEYSVTPEKRQPRPTLDILFNVAVATTLLSSTLAIKANKRLREPGIRYIAEFARLNPELFSMTPSGSGEHSTGNLLPHNDGPRISTP